MLSKLFSKDEASERMVLAVAGGSRDACFLVKSALSCCCLIEAVRLFLGLRGESDVMEPPCSTLKLETLGIDLTATALLARVLRPTGWRKIELSSGICG